MKRILILIACCVPGSLSAQNVWYFGTAGGSPASGVTTANQVVTFTNSGTGSLAPLTATFPLVTSNLLPLKETRQCREQRLAPAGFKV